MTGKIISANSDGSYQVQLDMQARQESDVHHSRLKHIGGTDITVQGTNSFAVDDDICMRKKTHHRGTVTEMNCTPANNASGDGNRNGSVTVWIAELGKREVIAADDMSRISRLKSACGGNDGGISTGDEVLVKSHTPPWGAYTMICTVALCPMWGVRIGHAASPWVGPSSRSR